MKTSNMKLRATKNTELDIEGILTFNFFFQA